MWINSFNGYLMINSNYLKNGDKVDVYLDLVHELVHVKQFLEGKQLFDNNYAYVDRPTEIEAYKYTVKEARRLGLKDERICLYLKTECMTYRDLEKLAKTLKIKCETYR